MDKNVILMIIFTCSDHLPADRLLLVHHDLQRADQGDIPRKLSLLVPFGQGNESGFV